MPSVICECGAIRDLVRDPAIPIVTDESGNVFILFTGKIREQIRFCPFCGGRRLRTSDNVCICNALMRWSERGGSNVRYDPALNEYTFTFGEGGKVFFYFCPECGGRIPKSRRSELFQVPSAEEMTEVCNKLEMARSLEEVKELLGEPDLVRELPPDHTVPSGNFATTAWFYDRHSKTFTITVQRMVDGTIRISFPAKENKV